MRNYKRLSYVERAFRSMKTIDLEVHDKSLLVPGGPKFTRPAVRQPGW